MKRLFFLICTIVTCLLPGNNAFASDTLKLEPSVNAAFVNRYVWRGQLLSASPAIQPTIDFTYGGLSVGSWASYSLTPDAVQEVDLYATYSFDFISFTLYDYYYLIDSVGYSNEYFNWENSTTSHLLELSSTAALGNLPLSLTAGVFLYGDDKSDTTGTENYYSTYFELAYNKTIGNTDFNAFIGVTPFEGYYSDKFSVVNLGLSLSREIKINTDYSIPISGSFIIDPDKENVFLVLGITF